MTTFQTVSDVLRKHGSALIKDSQDARPLRETQRALLEVQYESQDADLRFLAFFLCVFIDDFFYHLAGDLPYSKTFNDIQHAALSKIGQNLVEMSNQLVVDRGPAIYAACKGLVSDYITQLAQASALPE